MIVVVKVGTSTIASENGLNGRFLLAFAGTIADAIEGGHKVVVVTSGAVGAGRWRLKAPKPRTIAEKQPLAAVGQGLLMHAYESLLAPLGIASAQLLLTAADLVDRQRYLNARTTLGSLLAFDPPVVPIINENDSVAVEELKFGDNDKLSALVAGLIDADWLVMLTDVPGLYDRPPDQDGATLLSGIGEITPQIEELAGGAGTDLGTGGMATKINAAKIATSSGTSVALLSGKHPQAILALLDGQTVTGTVFKPKSDRLEARRRWLAFGRPVRGTLVLDDGAVKAVGTSGKSLLPAGVRALTGEFEPGEAVSLRAGDGREVARGVCNYASGDLARILGKQSSEIEAILGCKLADEVVHRNNMVVL